MNVWKLSAQQYLMTETSGKLVRHTAGPNDGELSLEFASHPQPCMGGRDTDCGQTCAEKENVMVR